MWNDGGRVERVEGVRKARRVEKRAEAEVDRFSDMMRRIDKLEKTVEKKFEEMGQGFDHRLASVVKKMVFGVVMELADPLYGRIFKEIWRPEEMELEEEEYRGLD